MKNNKIKLIIILLIALILRAYKIDTFPALNPDEAALGYNAYSLIETGKDEHGISWPLHFKSFGDFKPGGYVYLAMPFIKLIGLTPLAVRLPNLILSILTIYILYKLIILLTTSNALSLCIALALSLSPWHIHFSRGAWESSAALFFIVLGIYWFYSYIIHHKSYFIYLFPLPFVASLYIYHSARIISPLIVIFLLIANHKLLITNFKKIILPFFVAILLTIPVLFSFLVNGGTTRFGGVGLLADYGPTSRAEELLNNHGNTKLVNRIIHNRRVLYGISWMQKYSSHFDLNFLFINGDEVPRSKSPEMGQLYLIELPLLLVGIIYLLKLQKAKALKHLTIALLFISPIASSLTFQAPSALRSLPMVIPFSILTGSGLYYLSTLFKTNLWTTLYYILIFVAYTYSLIYFIDTYFIHSPQRYPYAWNNGFSEVVPYVENQKTKFSDIYFTDKYDQPYILYLFYSKYDPSKIQTQIKLTSPDKFGFSTVSQIDNIHFGRIEWDKIKNNSLVISSDEPISNIPQKIINFPNGQPGFKIYTK